jgi:hypothetical protein
MNTIEEAINYLDNNKLLLNGNQRMTSIQIQNIFKIYFILTGDRKDTTTCSRCILNMLKRIKVEYDKYKANVKTHIIYRTNFGQLTLKQTKTIAYTITLKEGDNIENKLQELKQQEKQN